MIDRETIQKMCEASKIEMANNNLKKVNDELDKGKNRISDEAQTCIGEAGECLWELGNLADIGNALDVLYDQLENREYTALSNGQLIIIELVVDKALEQLKGAIG